MFIHTISENTHTEKKFVWNTLKFLRCFWKIVNYFSSMSHFSTPENFKESKAFWRFQGVWKWNIELKWVNETLLYHKVVWKTLDVKLFTLLALNDPFISESCFQQPLTIITKRSILDIAAALDPPLVMKKNSSYFFLFCPGLGRKGLGVELNGVILIYYAMQTAI